MSDLRGTNAPKEVRFGSTGKIIAAVVILLGIGGGAAYIHETAQKPAPKPVVSADRLPTMPSSHM